MKRADHESRRHVEFAPGSGAYVCRLPNHPDLRTAFVRVRYPEGARAGGVRIVPARAVWLYFRALCGRMVLVRGWGQAPRRPSPTVSL